MTREEAEREKNTRNKRRRKRRKKSTTRSRSLRIQMSLHQSSLNGTMDIWEQEKKSIEEWNSTLIKERRYYEMKK